MPKVSFVVPCYNLAHLLSACVSSVLAQTYTDFEIIILDDCSPDNTREVAASFEDGRVRYLRNPVNLGHLRNYNKGIAMARGTYIWLLSPDDLLRRPYVLERYVGVLEAHPQMGYVCCPAIELVDGQERGLVGYSHHGGCDRCFEGRDFLVSALLFYNGVVVCSALARAECYQKLGDYPLDMPYAGDWYLWSLFALHTQVGYCAEPMVCYRVHDESMTSVYEKSDLTPCIADNLSMPWRMYRLALELGDLSLAEHCRKAIIYQYACHLGGHVFRGSRERLTLDGFEASLDQQARSESEKCWLRPRVYAAAADCHFVLDDVSTARELYWRALRLRPATPLVWCKYLLLLFASSSILSWLRRARRLGGLRP